MKVTCDPVVLAQESLKVARRQSVNHLIRGLIHCVVFFWAITFEPSTVESQSKAQKTRILA